MSSLQEYVPNQEIGDDARTEEVDFRMITFSLGGRDYGIDIMDVKEISKVQQFTYVPNTADYVKGVFNLRGEIISIIDLRMMFQLPVPEREPGEPEDVIFLRSDDHIIGVIVDQVNDVVGVSSADIQPPHPLFGAINIRYISGVVESGESLYIILASEMVFGDEIVFEETPEPELLVEEIEPVTVEAQPDLDYTFVQEALQTFRSFYVSELNEEWMRLRFETWVVDCQKRGASVQLQDHDEADSYLGPFYSPHTGELWRGDFVKGMIELLPELASSTIAAWVIGAGDGHDAYSLACILRLKYPEASIKIWAHDSDLLSISSAPSIVYDSESIPSEFEQFLTEGPRGYTFNEEIRNSVYFEYHDVMHENAFPEVQAIVVRDFLSFQSEQSRAKLYRDLSTKIVPGGIVIPGHNEVLPAGWKLIESRSARAYTHTSD